MCLFSNHLTNLCSGAGTSSLLETASANSMRASWEEAEDNFILRHEIKILNEELEYRIDQTKLIKIYRIFVNVFLDLDQGSRC